MKIFFRILLFFSFCQMAFAQNMAITSFYEGPFEDVTHEAQRLKKPIFIDFTSTTCKHCLKMEKEAFSNLSLANHLNDNFIAYKVDLEDEEGKKIAKLYGVTEFPTYIILDSKTQKLGSIKGFYMANQFKKELDRIIILPNFEKPAKKRRRLFG